MRSPIKVISSLFMSRNDSDSSHAPIPPFSPTREHLNDLPLVPNVGVDNPTFSEILSSVDMPTPSDESNKFISVTEVTEADYKLMEHFLTRFEITYQNPALNNDAFNTNKCVAFVASGEFKIQASKTINSIAIYDITGRKITEYFPNSKVYSHSFFNSIGVYFAKITFDDKTSTTQKVLNDSK